MSVGRGSSSVPASTSFLGFLDLKTHSKLSLVVRQEGNVVRRYVHLGTGNYNPTTAVLYTDLGLFTADEDIAADASALFNLLTGYSQGHQWRKLVVAPGDLHRRTIELIDEQTRRARAGRPSRIFAKLNALVDYRVIEALYRASQAGVPIDLVVRGICCLRPGMPGISENIRVRSIVDRFLEHSRLYIFSPDDEAQIYLASADWMPRNFYRRVEVMFPIEAEKAKERILEEIVPAYLRDNVKARILCADGTHYRAQRAPDEPRHRCQEELLYGRVRGARPWSLSHWAIRMPSRWPRMATPRPRRRRTRLASHRCAAVAAQSARGYCRANKMRSNCSLNVALDFKDRLKVLLAEGAQIDLFARGDRGVAGFAFDQRRFAEEISFAELG